MSHSTPASLPATPRPLLEKQRKQLPPGPSWHTAAWNTVKFARQTLSFLQELRERYGDLVTLPTVLGPWTLVFHPDGVRHVVQENHFNYRKGGISNQVLSLALGNGLLTNNGDSWLHQRRLIQPVFHRQWIAAIGRLMTESALAWTQEESLDTRQPLDLFEEMSGLTLNIVGKALFARTCSRKRSAWGRRSPPSITCSRNPFTCRGFCHSRHPNAIACMRPATYSTPSLTS